MEYITLIKGLGALGILALTFFIGVKFNKYKTYYQKTENDKKAEAKANEIIKRNDNDSYDDIVDRLP
jgi:hypothetical protein